MGIEILASIISAIATLIAGGLVSTKLIRTLLQRFFGIQQAPSQSYTEKLTELTQSLTKSSAEVDAVLSELAKVARERENAVQRLENELQNLERREKELQEKIETLEQVPIPVAEHFANLVESGEKRGARRDYILFGAGVVVTTIVAIIIQIAIP